MKITGQIVGIGSPVMIYDASLPVEQLATFYKDFTAPGTKDSKTFQTIANAYRSEFFYTELESGYFFSDYTIPLLNTMVVSKAVGSYIYYDSVDEGFPYGYFKNSISGQKYAIGYEPEGTTPLATATINTPFTVVAPPATVDVKVNNVDGPITCCLHRLHRLLHLWHRAVTVNSGNCSSWHD